MGAAYSEDWSTITIDFSIVICSLHNELSSFLPSLYSSFLVVVCTDVVESRPGGRIKPIAEWECNRKLTKDTPCFSNIAWEAAHGGS